MADIEKTLTKHEGTGLKKSAQWVVSGKDDVLKLRMSLEAHKSALDIALDFVTMTLAFRTKEDTEQLLVDTSEIKETMKQDTALILAEITRLQRQLPQDEIHTSGFVLQRYLDNLTSYAETVQDLFIDDDPTPSDCDETINFLATLSIAPTTITNFHEVEEGVQNSFLETRELPKINQIAETTSEDTIISSTPTTFNNFPTLSEILATAPNLASITKSRLENLAKDASFNISRSDSSQTSTATLNAPTGSKTRWKSIYKRWYYFNINTKA